MTRILHTSRTAILLLLTCSLATPATAQSSLDSENTRFPNGPFYRALRKRGLTDLLDMHLQLYPPANDIDASLLRRDVTLAKFEDTSRSPSQRYDAITAANQILAVLIEENPDNNRLRQWRIELAQSRLYKQADPTISQILFKGARPQDRARLNEIMTATVADLANLRGELQTEYDALDDLPARVYDKMEAKGEVEKLESDLSLTDYMLAWSRFYLAITRDNDDPDRIPNLRNALEYLNDRSHLLKTPHAETHYQAQATILAGMIHRQLAEYAIARRHLARSIDIVADILDEQEKASLQWVQTLARIELVRSFVDVNNHATAKQAAKIFEDDIRTAKPLDNDRLLLAGLLQRFVYRTEAAHLNDDTIDTRDNAVAVLIEESTQLLARLAETQPRTRNKIYANVYDHVGPNTPANQLSTFETAVAVTGALTDADNTTATMNAWIADGLPTNDPAITKLNDQRRALLQRAVDLSETILDNTSAPNNLRREVAFNRAVAHYRLGQRKQAATAFLHVTKKFPDHPRALDAATYAAQLTFELRSDPALAANDDIRALHVDALKTLTTTFPDAPDAQYWLFFLAQQFADQNDFIAAADTYAKVPQSHERYHEARFLAAEAQVLTLQTYAAQNPDRVDLINRKATVADFAARQAQRTLTKAIEQTTDPDRRRQLTNLLARTDLILAEADVVTGVNRHQDALDTLKSFQDKYGRQPDLLGRVLRVRTIALEALGRHTEATRLIPEYVAKDPTGAPPTLQALFESINEDIARDRKAGRSKDADEKAATAVAIAQGIYTAAKDQPALFNKQTVYALRLQLAEAYLTADRFTESADLFEECLSEDAARHPNNEPRDSRAIYGAAETRYQSNKFEEALPLFNQIYKSSPKDDILKWKSLLRDLQCRTELDHPKDDIIRAIQQHRYLNPTLGSPDLRRDFDNLLKRNEQRAG